MELHDAETQSTPSEVGIAFRVIYNRLKNLSEEDIRRMSIEFFSDKNNIDATTAFVVRHPECPYAKYIPKENKQ